MCKYFFDLGSHLFESVYEFSKLYQDAAEYNVFCFEAAYESDLRETINSILPKIHSDLEFASFSFLPVAVSTESTIETLKRDLSYPDSESSSLRRDKNMEIYKFIKVPSIDLALFLRAVVSADDYCILKIDIEGSEYELVEYMNSVGILPLIRRVYIELHEHKLTKDISKDFKLLETLLAHGIEVMSWDAAGSCKNNYSNHCKKIDHDYIRKLSGYGHLTEDDIIIF